MMAEIDLGEPAVWGAGDGATSEPETASDVREFDFASHARLATEQYRQVQPRYSDFSRTLGDILRAKLVASDIRYHTLEYRAKDLDSFERKAQRATEKDPTRPKYPDPVQEITDLAAARVITF